MTRRMVTLPNGEKAARHTSRDYKFAVCVQYSDTFYAITRRGTWEALSWHTRPELAERTADKLRECPQSYATVTILPVL